jgi:hypothetical protein
MPIAARSSQDLACCWRATSSARLKYACAFASAGSGDFNAISAAHAMDFGPANLSLVLSIAVIASPMKRQDDGQYIALDRNAECCLSRRKNFSNIDYRPIRGIRSTTWTPH